jgi:signal transduction histidine kinase
MDAETLRKAFQPGFTTKETGTGLGLALVRSALSHYGGSIRLESEAGRGTRVHVELPASEDREV